MISDTQTDATTLNQTITATTTNITNHHPSRSNSVDLKSSKSFNSKKRKKIDETILEDEWSIIAFSTLDDLKDYEAYTLHEVNSRDDTANTDIYNNDHINNNNNNISNNLNNNINSSSINKNETHCTANDKKFNSKSKQKLSSTSTSDTTSNSSTANNDSNKNSECIKRKIKKSAGHSQAKFDSKDKTSLEKTILKKAKELSILQEKLKKEQSKTRNTNSNNTVKISETNTITQEHFSSPQTPNHVTKEEHHSRSNGLIGHDISKDSNTITKTTPYSPFHINSHLHRPNSAIPNQMQLHNPPPAPSSPPRQNQQQSHLQIPKHSLQRQPQHSTPPLAPQPNTHMHHQVPEQTTLQPPLLHQLHSPYQRTPLHATPQPMPHLPHLQHPNPHQPPQMNPYSTPPSNSIMSSMGLGTLPTPYSCPPPSIYITDTISRQTSIIPPPTIAPALEPIPSSQSNGRFGQHSSSVLHSITPYSSAVPPHHSMYYPTLPTERSFIEFARSYTGPSHLAYPNLMNSFPTSAPSITANPYSFDRWPRVSLDHQRAVSRYNSLYQGAPDRTAFSNYATRPPSFPAGLFVSNPPPK